MALQVKANEEAGRLGLSLNTARIPERYAFAWFEEATPFLHTPIVEPANKPNPMTLQRYLQAME